MPAMMEGISGSADMEEEVKVLSVWASMFGMRVLIALEEKGVKYEYVEENLVQKSDIVLQCNPIHKKIPVLIHNGRPVCESLIIVEYIDEVWGSPSFFPKDAYDRAVARFWADYLDKKFFDALKRVVWESDRETQEQGKSELITVVTTLEKAVQEVGKGKPFFGGERIGFVDIAIAPIICWLKAAEEMGKFQVMDESKTPTFCEWTRKVQEVPSVKKVLPPPHKLAEDYVKYWKNKFNIA